MVLEVFFCWKIAKNIINEALDQYHPFHYLYIIILDEYLGRSMCVVMGKKIRTQPLEELTEMFKTLQEKEKIQDCLIRNFQKLIRNEGLSSSVIMSFPYPLAVFWQNGDLVFVNSAFSKETELYAVDLSENKHSILNRITDANFRILNAVENVFMGETTFLTGLSDPLAIFISEKSSKIKSSSNYQDAVFFPIIEDSGQTTHGAVIFMK